MTLYKHFLSKATKALTFAHLAAPSADDQNTIELLILSIRALLNPNLDLSKESGLPSPSVPVHPRPCPSTSEPPEDFKRLYQQVLDREAAQKLPKPGPIPESSSVPSVPLWCNSPSPGPQPATTDAPGERTYVPLSPSVPSVPSVDNSPETPNV